VVRNLDYPRGVTAGSGAKKVRPLLDESCFTLETAPDAYRRLVSGKARGKVVIDIAPVSRQSNLTPSHLVGAELTRPH
jgi:hypothetical protein